MEVRPTCSLHCQVGNFEIIALLLQQSESQDRIDELSISPGQAIQKVIRSGSSSLRQMTFFPGGGSEAIAR